MKFVLIAAVAAAASLTVAASASTQSACTPFVKTPDVSSVPGSVIASGGTEGCHGVTYHWLGAVQDDEGHARSIGGVATGDLSASGQVGCLKPDGSPRNVRAVLAISYGGVTKTAASQFVACHRP